MKKLFALAMAVCLAFTLCSCTRVDIPAKTENNQKEQAKTETRPLTQDEAELESGRRAYENGRLEQAMTELNAISEGSTVYDQAQLLLRAAVAAYKEEVFAKTDEYVEKKELLMAVQYLEQSIAKVPDTAMTKGELLELNERYYAIDHQWKQDVKSAALAQAEGLAEKEDYAAAVACLEDAVSKIGEDAEIRTQISSYEAVRKQRIKTEALEKAAACLEQKDYAAAIACLKDTISKIGEDSEVRAQLSACEELWAEEQIATALKLAEEHFDGGETEKAISTLENAVNSGLQSERLNLTLEQYKEVLKQERVEEVVTNAKKAKKEEDSEKAITILQTGIKEYGSRADLTSLLDQYTAEYRSKAIDDAAAVYVRFDADSITAAEDIIKTALGVLKEDPVLKEELDRYVALEPGRLLALEYTKEGEAWLRYVFSDGREGIKSDDGAGSRTYQLDSQYARLTGKFEKVEGHYSATSTDQYPYIKIWTDGRLVYSKVLTEMGVEEFEIDLRNVTTLTITIYKYEDYRYDDGVATDLLIWR